MVFALLSLIFIVFSLLLLTKLTWTGSDKAHLDWLCEAAAGTQGLLLEVGRSTSYLVRPQDDGEGQLGVVEHSWSTGFVITLTPYLSY